jgi:exosome complex RNA-binding protein Csl4
MSTTYVDSAGQIVIPGDALTRYVEEAEAAGGVYDDEKAIVTAIVSFVGPCLVAELRSLVASMRDFPSNRPLSVDDVESRIAQIEKRVAEVLA